MAKKLTGLLIPYKIPYAMAGKMQSVNFIDEPYFSVAELASVAEIDRGLADQWIHRSLIRPTRVERAGSRNRPIFSVRGVFKARLICILNDRFNFAPGQSAPVANDSDSAELAELLAGEDWMYAAARGIDRSKPMNFWVAVTRIQKCWRWQLIFPTESGIAPFGPAIPYIMLPLPEMFSPVYLACRAIHAGSPPEKMKAPRARS